jgi:hypothetical protein
MLRLDEVEDAGDPKFGSQFLGLHRGFLFPGDYYPRSPQSRAITNVARHWERRRAVARPILRELKGIEVPTRPCIDD